MSQNNTPKTVLITGASRGIGRKIAERFGADGAMVFVNYAGNAAAAEDAVAAIEAAGGQAVAVQADVGDPVAVDGMFEQLKDALRDRGLPVQLDILVNNAGVGVMASLAETSVADYDAVMNSHVKGAFFVTQSALPILSEGGRIIMMSSAFATRPTAGVAAYIAAKGALIALTEALAVEVADRKITVNAVAPGWTLTDINRDVLADKDMNAFVTGKTALGRIGRTEDIARVVGFLASDEASWVTAQTIEASGGWAIAH